MTQRPAPFWRSKRLADMTEDEWESLCDSCGKCCLHKLEDPDTRRFAYTNVACFMLDVTTCRCSDYEARLTYVPDCIQLTAGAVDKLGWLPASCAYRRVAEGKGLKPWHPLVSGSRETVHRAGVSVRGRAISEPRHLSQRKHQTLLLNHIVDWWD